MKKVSMVIACMMISGAMLVCADETKDKSGDAAKDKIVAAKKAQTLCPVMGEAIDRTLYVDAAGKRIYVCCSACIKKVKADPAKYIKLMEAQGIELEKVPAKK